MYVGHDAADHQQSTGADHQHQQHGQYDAGAGCAGIAFAGLGQGMLEVLQSLLAELLGNALGRLQVAGHAIQVGAQVFEIGTAGNQLLRGGQGIVGVAFYRGLPVLQPLAELCVILGQRLEAVMQAGDFLEHAARLVQCGQFARGHGTVEQCRKARELEDRRVGPLQRRVTGAFQGQQALVVVRQLQRGVDHEKQQAEQGNGR